VLSPPFRFNKRYTFDSRGRRLVDLTNREADQGLLRFTPRATDRLRIPYHTRYGGTSCTTQVYRETIRGLSLALHRQFNCRKPERVGYCEHLYWSQNINLRLTLNSFVQYAHILAPHFTNFHGRLEEELRHYADAHPKRALRVRAHLEALLKGSIAHQTRLERERVVAKFKIELAKIGKVPRIIVDLGVAASLAGAWYASTLKEAMAMEPLRTGNLFAWFCPTASYTNLKKAFDLLYDPPAPFTIVLFSDDAAIAVRGPDGVRWIDMDISSCDKSHTAGIFNMLRILTPAAHQEVVEALLAQLRAPLLIRHPNHRSRERVLATPIEETLYSGSTLTTVINNVAVMAIADIAASDPPAIDASGVARAAELIGYIVECNQRSRFEDMQFLKHSPCRDVNGEWQPVLNLGVFARSSGNVFGELPGSAETPLAERARRQHASMLQCMWPNTHFPMLDAARAQYQVDPGHHALYVESYLRNTMRVIDGWPHLYFTDESVLRRYEIAPSDANGLRQLLGGPLFHVYTGPDIEATLRKDYSLSHNQTHLAHQPAEWLPNLL